MRTEHRREPHRSEHTQTSNSHLETHRQSHLFAFEPFGKNLTYRSTGHLATATEDHKTEHRQFGATRHRRPPCIQPFHRIGVRPRDTPVLDACTDHHETCREQTGETNAHLIQNDTGKNQKSEYIKQVFTGSVGAKHTLIPSDRVVQQRCQGGQNIYEHIREEHHRSHEDKNGPAGCCAIAKCLLNFLYHN